MPLSWNEIKDRALAFSQEWPEEASESAEAESFWDFFFNIFCVPHRANHDVIREQRESRG